LKLLAAALIEKTIEPCKIALKDLRVIQLLKLTKLFLVGGMTRMPKVVETVKSFFGKNQIKVLTLMKLLL
jgi:molecular chaperone DnaK